MLLLLTGLGATNGTVPLHPEEGGGRDSDASQKKEPDIRHKLPVLSCYFEIIAHKDKS